MDFSPCPDWKQAESRSTLYALAIEDDVLPASH